MEGKEITTGNGKGILDGPSITVVVIFWLLAVIVFFSQGTFWSAVLTTILFSVLCLPAAAAGNLFRKMFSPDFVLASSTGGLVKAKLFWMFGPQATAVFIALLISLVAFTSKDDVAREAAAVEGEKQEVVAAEEQHKQDLIMLERLKTDVTPCTPEAWEVASYQLSGKATAKYPAPVKDELETVEEFNKREKERELNVEKETARLRKEIGFEVGKLYRFTYNKGRVTLKYDADEKYLYGNFRPADYGTGTLPVSPPIDTLFISLFGKAGMCPYKTHRYGLPFTIDEVKAIRGSYASLSEVPVSVDIVAKFPESSFTQIIITKK